METCRTKAFDEIKRIVTRDTILIYPDVNKRFDIHTYAGEFHLRAVIIQTGKPTAFYSRKLTKPQKMVYSNGKGVT